MRKINALGIKYPNSAILVENIIKQNTDDELIINLKNQHKMDLKRLRRNMDMNIMLKLMEMSWL